MRYAPSSAFSPRSSKGRGAFSLLEVAIALVIFVIGAIALLRIFPSGLNVLENSGNRRVAAQMSQNVLTSYNSGDLAQTTPDAIYNLDPNTGGWNDYYASALGLRRQAGTVPVDSDDFNSAKDALKFINGEKQGISNGAVYTNYPADGRVNLFREGTVRDVSILGSGEIDFRNANYINNQRTDKPQLPFREPILNIDSIKNDTSALPVAINGDAAVIERSGTNNTYTVVFSLDPSDVSDTVDISALSPDPIVFDANSSDCTSATLPPNPTTDPLYKRKRIVQLTVPAKSSTPQANVVVRYSINSITGVSSSRKFYSFLIASDGNASPSPVSGELLTIRAPYQLRQDTSPPIFYVSYVWAKNSLSQGVVSQPMLLPKDESIENVPLVGSVDSIAPEAKVNISFRQSLGGASSNGDRIKFPLGSATFNDVDKAVNRTNLTNISLDYSVRSWEYIAEDVSQFGTPFPGSSTPVDTTTPQGTVVSEFLNGAGYGPVPLSDVREIRTRVGNLRGIVQIQGFYEQSSQLPPVTAFDINASTPPNGSTVSPQDYARQKKALGKQGRLFLPANYKPGTTIFPLSHARVYYRSKDAWVQQVGVAASHYVPFVANAPAREPWREYFQGSDGYLYFHATEAGKTVECVHGTTISDASTDQVEIMSDVQFVTAVPARTPSATNFTTMMFNNVNNTSDPRNGKFYLARSRNRVSNTIFDVRRPVGTSGISVRTMWLDGARYAQEIAQ